MTLVTWPNLHLVSYYLVQAKGLLGYTAYKQICWTSCNGKSEKKLKYPNSNYQHNIRLSCRLITHTTFDYDYIGLKSGQLTHFCCVTFAQRPLDVIWVWFRCFWWRSAQFSCKKPSVMTTWLTWAHRWVTRLPRATGAHCIWCLFHLCLYSRVLGQTEIPTEEIISVEKSAVAIAVFFSLFKLCRVSVCSLATSLSPSLSPSWTRVPLTFISARNCQELHLNEGWRPTDQLSTLAVQQ